MIHKSFARLFLRFRHNARSPLSFRNLIFTSLIVLFVSCSIPSIYADLLGDTSDEDLLGEWQSGRDAADTTDVDDARKAHEELFAENRYPSAATCATCHAKQYREWSVSQHAYSQLSPVYMALNNTINVLTSGSD